MFQNIALLGMNYLSIKKEVIPEDELEEPFRDTMTVNEEEFNLDVTIKVRIVCHSLESWTNY